MKAGDMERENAVYPKWLLVVLATALVHTAGCSSKRIAGPAEFNPEFRFDPYEIVELDMSERWYNWMYPIGFDLDFPHDADGVIVSYWNNGYHYHPWQVADKAIWYLAGYQQTSDERYLDFVYSYARRLALMGIRKESGIFLPYTFDYALHAGNENEVMMYPWFSGLAQGNALSFFSRAYETTGDNYFKALADSLFNTFMLIDSDSDIWTVFVDSLNYYWIEEYPFSPKTHVLNGFLTAIFGLYDYYLISHDGRCAILFEASCTTIARYVHEFRNPGDISFYCLLHKAPLLGYHHLVIQQLRYMTDITSAEYFGAFADTLEADHE